MIYTVTFNPSLDYVVHMDAFNIGETNRTSSEELHFGGKGINVSAVLTNLGVANTALGFVAGFTGVEIEKQINELGIKTDFIKLRSGISRINMKINSGVETEINGRGPKIEKTELNELFDKVQKLKAGDIIVLAGSVPENLPNNTYEKLLATLFGKGIDFVVDATGDLLVNTLKFKPFLVKPNIKELGDIFSVEIENEQQAQVYAEKMQEMGGKNILVSMGKNGAFLVSEDGKIFKSRATQVELKSSVGAGDSMVAGFLAGWIQKNDYQYALNLGSAAGGATASSVGLATNDEIYDTFKRLEDFK